MFSGGLYFHLFSRNYRQNEKSILSSEYCIQTLLYFYSVPGQQIIQCPLHCCLGATDTHCCTLCSTRNAPRVWLTFDKNLIMFYIMKYWYFGFIERHTFRFTDSKAKLSKLKLKDKWGFYELSTSDPISLSYSFIPLYALCWPGNGHSLLWERGPCNAPSHLEKHITVLDLV